MRRSLCLRSLKRRARERESGTVFPPSSPSFLPSGQWAWQQVVLTFPCQTALFVDFLQTFCFFKLHPSSFYKLVPCLHLPTGYFPNGVPCPHLSSEFSNVPPNPHRGLYDTLQPWRLLRSVSGSRIQIYSK